METSEYRTRSEPFLVRISSVGYIAYFRNVLLDFILINSIMACNTPEAFLQIFEQVSRPYFVVDPLPSSSRYVGTNTKVTHYLLVSFIYALILMS